MLSNETKLRLVHAVTDQAVADEIEKRLLSATPGSTSAASAILANLNQNLNKEIEIRLVHALADESSGRYLANKLNKMVDVLKAYADGNEVAGTPAVAASFTGQVAGMTTDVTIDADNDGVAGNSVLLSFNGSDDIDAAILAWNTANPANTVTLTSGNGSQIPDNAEEIALVDGADEVLASDANTAAEQALMGSDLMDSGVLVRLTHALTDVSAANELKSKLESMIGYVQAISP